MAHPGETIENPFTGECITFPETTEDTGGELLRFEYAALPHAEGPPKYVHPRQEERFEVVSGTLVARAGGCERTLGEGQSVTIAAGTPHTFRNPGEEEVRFLVEFRPALGIEPFFETAWGLVRDGKATALGVPKNPLQLAVLAAAYRDEVYFTRRRSAGYWGTARGIPSTVAPSEHPAGRERQNGPSPSRGRWRMGGHPRAHLASAALETSKALR